MRNKKKLFYYIHDIQRDAIKEKIRFSYNEKYVSKINIFYVYLWNTGWEIIDEKDIARNTPIKLQFKCKNWIIDNISIFKQNNISNDFSLQKTDEKSYKIDFDYINPNDGVVFKIIQIGDYPPKLIKYCFELSGKIKGYGNPYLIPNLSLFPIFPLFKDKKRTLSFLILMIIVIITSYSLLDFFLSQEPIGISIIFTLIISAIPQTYEHFFRYRLPIDFEMIENMEVDHLNIIQK